MVSIAWSLFKKLLFPSNKSKVLVFLMSAGFILLCSGCGDVPYSNPKNYSIEGVVELGSAVRNAKVSAFQWKDLQRGELLQTTESDANGKYSLSYSSKYEGPVLLVVTQGNYRDPVTRVETPLKEDESLLSPVVQSGANVNINAWTTFAAARAQVTRNTFASDNDAISANVTLIGSHLRSERNPVAILTAMSIKSWKGTNIDDNKLIVATHVGLAQLAKKSSTSLIHLIQVLTEDISDGVWSGAHQGNQLFFDQSQAVPVSTDATRVLLAQSIDECLSTSCIDVASDEDVHAAKITREEFQKKGGLYESLCFDAREALYPPSEKPRSFETTENIQIRTEAEKDWSIAVLATGNDMDRALFWLIKRDKVNAIKLAKTAGANLNAEIEGYRPIEYAILNNKAEAVRALVVAGVELNYMRGIPPPLHMAAMGECGRKPVTQEKSGCNEIIAILIKGGADVNWTANNSIIPVLQDAQAAHGDPSTTQLLLALGANVNAVSQNGTAAHIAVQMHRFNSLKILLENGANPYLKDANGKDVFTVAHESMGAPDSEKILNLLASYR